MGVYKKHCYWADDMVRTPYRARTLPQTFGKENHHMLIKHLYQISQKWNLFNSKSNKVKQLLRTHHVGCLQ